MQLREQKYWYHWQVLGWVVSLLIFSFLYACSTQKNTSLSRFYHNLTTRYNTYYNATELYEEEYKKLWLELAENYVTPIPPDPIRYQVNPNKTIGGAFDKVIEKTRKAIEEHSIRTKPEKTVGWRQKPKAVAMQRKTEYNSFLYHCWLLLGKAQFYNADLNEAISTFAYISDIYETAPEIRDQARLWQIRALNNLGRYVETTPLVALVDTTSQAIKHHPYLYHLTQGERLLGLRDTLKALPHLEQAANYSVLSEQRARLYFLCGQLAQAIRQTQRAYKNFNQVSGLSLSSGLDFASQLKHIELSPRGYTPTLKQLTKMVAQRRYQNQRGQIYFTIGQLYLSHRDTLNAQIAFLKGTQTSSDSQQDYALNLIALGDLYWGKQNYWQAWQTYQTALPILNTSSSNKEYIEYIVTSLSPIQSELSSLHRLDSLVHVVAMPERERMELIQKQIKAYQQRTNTPSQYTPTQDLSLQDRFNTALPTPSSILSSPADSKSFYFYNQSLLSRGRREFLRLWGKRALEDNWQRKDRSLNTPQELDSISPEEKISNTLKEQTETREELSINDPNNPAYYLAQLPFSPEQRQQTDSIRSLALMTIGQVLQNQLGQLDKAIANYNRIVQEFPQSQEHGQALHQLYILYQRTGKTNQAEQVRKTYLQLYPNTPVATDLSRSDYYQHLIQRDSLIETYYQEAFFAYQKQDYANLSKATEKLISIEPQSIQATKAHLLLALADAQQGNLDSFSQRIKSLATNPIDSVVADYALALLQGVNAGKKPIPSAGYLPLWERTTLSSEHNTHPHLNRYEVVSQEEPYQILIATKPSFLESNTLRFLITAWGYARFTQTPPEIRVVPLSDYTGFLIGGLAGNLLLKELTSKDGISSYTQIPLHILPISKNNLQRLEQVGNLSDYLDFAHKYLPQAHITKMEVSEVSPSSIPQQQIPTDINTEVGELPTLPIQTQEVSPHHTPTLDEMRQLDREVLKRKKEEQNIREKKRRETNKKKYYKTK